MGIFNNMGKAAGDAAGDKISKEIHNEATPGNMEAIGKGVGEGIVNAALEAAEHAAADIGQNVSEFAHNVENKIEGMLHQNPGASLASAAVAVSPALAVASSLSDMGSYKGQRSDTSVLVQQARELKEIAKAAPPAGDPGIGVQPAAQQPAASHVSEIAKVAGDAAKISVAAGFGGLIQKPDLGSLAKNMHVGIDMGVPQAAAHSPKVAEIAKSAKVSARDPGMNAPKF